MLLAIENEAYRDKNSILNLATAAEKIQNRYNDPATRQELATLMQKHVVGNRENPLQPTHLRNIPNLKTEDATAGFNDAQDLAEKLKSAFSISKQGEGKAALVNISIFDYDEATYTSRASKISPEKSLAIQHDATLSDKYYAYDPKSGSYTFESFEQMQLWLDKQIQASGPDKLYKYRLYRGEPASISDIAENRVNTVTNFTVQSSKARPEDATALLLAVENEAYKGDSILDLPQAAQNIQNRFDSSAQKTSLQQEMWGYISNRNSNPLAPENKRNLPNLLANKQHDFFTTPANLDEKLKSLFNITSPTEGNTSLVNISLFDVDKKTYANRALSLKPKSVLAIQRDINSSDNFIDSKYHVYDPSSGSYGFDNYNKMKEWVDNRIAEAGQTNTKALRAYRYPGGSSVTDIGQVNRVTASSMPTLSDSGALLLAIEDAAFKSDTPQELSAVAQQFQDRYDVPKQRDSVLAEVYNYYKPGSEIPTDAPSTSRQGTVARGDKLPISNPLYPDERRKISNLSLVPGIISVSDTNKFNRVLEGALKGNDDAPPASLINVSLYKPNIAPGRSGVKPEYSYGIQRLNNDGGDYLTARYTIYSPQSGSYKFDNFNDMQKWLNGHVEYFQQHGTPVTAMRVYHKPLYGPEPDLSVARPYSKANIHTPYGTAQINLGEYTTKGKYGSVGVISGPNIPNGYDTGYSIHARRRLGIEDERTLHPLVHDLYESVPAELRSPYHSYCVEADVLSKLAWENGIHTVDELKQMVKGSHMSVYNSFGHYLPPCSSCKEVQKILGYSALKQEADFE